MSDIQCICCGKDLDSEDTEGVVFTGSGNWMSTVFDCIHHKGLEHLEITVCDDCLKERKDRIWHVRKHGEPTFTHQPFKQYLAHNAERQEEKP